MDNASVRIDVFDEGSEACSAIHQPLLDNRKSDCLIIISGEYVLSETYTAAIN